MGEKRKRIIKKVLLCALAGLIGFVLLAFVAIYIPPVQTAIKNFVLERVKTTSGLDITAGQFRLRFPLSLSLAEVNVVQANGDTMATVGALTTEVKVIPLLRGKIDIVSAQLTDASYRLGTNDSAMMLRVKIRSLTLDRSSYDLSNDAIDINRAALDGADVILSFNDSVPSPPADTTKSESLPLTIIAKNIDITNVAYRMSMLPTIDSLGAYIPSATLRSAIVDMQSRKIAAESIAVDSVTATYLTPNTADTTPSTATAPLSQDSIDTPLSDLWTITADKITLTANSATYATKGAEPQSGLDMSYLQANNVTIEVDSFRNRGVEITVPLRNLSATERCGVDIHASGLFQMDSTSLSATGFTITTGFSTLDFNALMGMGDLTMNPALPLRLAAQGTLSPVDIKKTFPALTAIVTSLPPASDINLHADINGTSGLMDINTISAKIPGIAAIELNGSIANTFDFNRMDGTVNINGTFSNINSIKPSILEAQLAKQLQLPPMSLRGTVNYNPGKVDGNVKMLSSGGDIALDGSWTQLAKGYNVELAVDSFPVNSFMPALGVGIITAEASLRGHGYDLLSPATNIEASFIINSIDYLDKTYTDATANVILTDSHATGIITSNNPDAELGIDFIADLSPDSITWNIDGDITNLDLLAMKLSTSTLNGSLAIKSTGTYTIKSNSINANATLKNTDFNIEGKRLYANSIDLLFKSDSTIITTISTGDLKGHLFAQCPLDTFIERLTNTLTLTDTLIARKNADVEALQKALPIVDMEVNAGSKNIVSDYLAMDGMAFSNAHLWFKSDSLISLSTNITRFTTATSKIDTITFGAAQHGKFLAFKGAINNRPGTFDNFAHVNLTGFLANDKLGVLLSQRNIKNERGFMLGLSLALTDSLATVRFVPYSPTIGYKQWTLNHDNFISYNFYNKHIDANLSLNSGQSYIKIFTDHAQNGLGQEDVVVQLSKINIEEWLSISPFAPPIKGDIGADMRIHWDETQLNGKGFVGLTDFYYGRDRVGSFNIDLDVNTTAAGVLKADAALMIDSVKVITATGALNDSTASNPFLLDFSMIRFPLRILNPFMPPHYARMRGMLNGRMDITGSLTSPVFNGFLDFDSTSVNVEMLGTEFKFSETEIPVENSIVSFNDFAITASNSNPLTVNGTVNMTDINDPRIDLALKASNMQIVNSSRPRKADVYGKAFVDVDATVRGNMNFIDVDTRLSLLAGTNVTYIFTTSQSTLASQSTGDMVKFVQFGDTTAVQIADSIADKTLAMNLNAELNIRQGSTINVDLSTDGKNKVSIAGQGDLDFSLSPFSDSRLTGRFNINSGFVRYTPPMMSEKLFNFQDGSFIAFNGNMMNPILNIHAVDKLKSNVTQSGQNSRLIDFEVSLAVTNTLQNMNVAFDLSTKDDITVQNELAAMSPDQRANQAMNLLLYNVYSGPGTKASSNLSGNPLYAFLESRINSWAASNIRGVDISFGIDQYDKTTDGATSQTTSYSYRVSKTLFNDRFKIIVGGNYSTDANTDENFSQNLINDIAFEYMLNRSGSMYVRIFRHTGYESILEGEITQTGVGFVLRRKINSIKDLFRWAGRLKRSITGQNKKTDTTAIISTPKEDEKGN